uniref:WGS project CAEQ00000000 data, annotated contig 2353 n=1 Tax=Trypanosoma congolense (strain IL3000) TaxID=1068625 RepID=F9WDD1_TRYCI|nr:unnamed protein product [Trypanosoma congolense IL3000]
MWLFSRGSSAAGSDGSRSGIVQPLPNAADAQVVMEKQIKAEGHAQSALSTSLIDRSKMSQLAMSKGDGRVAFFDTESIDCILKRYEREMTLADMQIKRKQEESDKKLFNFYDYEKDQRYNQWLADQQRVRENLKLHWLDLAIDRPMLSLKYLARVGTTVGLFYGVGRTVFLYRTMDKMYAKLYGVSVANIALYEVSCSVIKGAIVSVAGSLGVVLGEAATNIVTTALTGDISVPERSWVNVWACGTSCGTFSGAMFAALHTSLLTTWGMAAAVAAFTTVGSLSGLGLGLYTYKPYAGAREKQINSPYWRPWYERRISDSGGSYMRGRYT